MVHITRSQVAHTTPNRVRGSFDPRDVTRPQEKSPITTASPIKNKDKVSR